MLYHILDDDGFEESLKKIMNFYFPQNDYTQLFERKILGEIKNYDHKLQDWIGEVINPTNEQNYHYQVYSSSTNTWISKPFPFLERFHEYFLEREWKEKQTGDYHYKEITITQSSDDLSYLYPYRGRKNNSKNYKDYNHFINVIAALARLIQFFSNTDHVKKLFNQDVDDELSEILSYNDDGQIPPNFRTFRLMMAGLLHDIGKTVIDARHGLEGRLIIGFHTSKAIHLINEILRSSNNQKKQIQNDKFLRNDLLFLGQLVYFHDSYGTLSTGENSYQKLVDIIDVIKRHSLGDVNSDPQQSNTEQNIKDPLFDWSRRNLFDLWLLNVADIVVSIKDKWQLQNGGHTVNIKTDQIQAGLPGLSFEAPEEQTTEGINWWDRDIAFSHIRAFFGIDENRQFDRQREPVRTTNNFFFNLNKGSVLIHDLKISFELLYLHNQRIYTDNLKTLQELALDHSKDHTVERLRRLLVVSMNRAINEITIDYDKLLDNLIEPNNIPNETQTTIIQRCTEEHEKIFNYIRDKLDDFHWNHSIVRSIESSGNFQEFSEKLANIGKIDYALGFFIAIVKRAIEKVAEEIMTLIIYQDYPDLRLKNVMKRTGWITDNRRGDDGIDGLEYYQIQAEAFADNYATTVISILSYLLSKYDSIKGVKNLEFHDAKERLTEEKIDKIIDLEGPFRSHRAIELILQTISIY